MDRIALLSIHPCASCITYGNCLSISVKTRDFLCSLVFVDRVCSSTGLAVPFVYWQFEKTVDIHSGLYIFTCTFVVVIIIN